MNILVKFMERRNMEIKRQIFECIMLMELIQKSDLPISIRVASVGANASLRKVELELSKAELGDELVYENNIKGGK